MIVCKDYTMGVNEMRERRDTVRQLLVLGMLLEGEMHGYRINEFVAHALMLSRPRSRSAVYHALGKLEEGRYVEQRQEREGKRPERYVYQITEAGRSFFLDLLRDDLRSAPPVHYLDDIGCVFLDQIPTGEAVQLLEEKRGKIEAALEPLEQHPSGENRWSHILARSVEHLKAELNWIDRILNELNGS